jgi:hypothetical protein
MKYKIIKATPDNTMWYPLGVTYHSYRQAVDALKTLKINYDLDHDLEQEQAAYLHDRNRILVAYDGGDRIEYHIRESRA